MRGILTSEWEQEQDEYVEKSTRALPDDSPENTSEKKGNKGKAWSAKVMLWLMREAKETWTRRNEMLHKPTDKETGYVSRAERNAQLKVQELYERSADMNGMAGVCSGTAQNRAAGPIRKVRAWIRSAEMTMREVQIATNKEASRTRSVFGFTRRRHEKTVALSTAQPKKSEIQARTSETQRQEEFLLGIQDDQDEKGTATNYGWAALRAVRDAGTRVLRGLNVRRNRNNKGDAESTTKGEGKTKANATCRQKHAANEPGTIDTATNANDRTNRTGREHKTMKQTSMHTWTTQRVEREAGGNKRKTAKFKGQSS